MKEKKISENSVVLQTSHIENISMSLTTTISSWSSSKIAPFMASEMNKNQ